MDREILFRGKTDDGKWIYGDLIQAKHGEFLIVQMADVMDMGRNAGAELLDSEEGFVLSETVGQFTGLTDKSGDKIFEGDIVKCENFIGEVIYRGDGFCIKNIPQFVDKSSWYIFNNCNVIGNIYDNPELLTDKT